MWACHEILIVMLASAFSMTFFPPVGVLLYILLPYPIFPDEIDGLSARVVFCTVLAPFLLMAWRRVIIMFFLCEMFFC